MENQYQDKLDEYISNITELMFIFEVTKCGGYSTFVSIYKEETLLDLYSRIINHFQITEIKELYFYSPDGERIRIPISKSSISQFIRTNTTGNSIKLIPIYPTHMPIVYRLYLDDGSSQVIC